MDQLGRLAPSVGGGLPGLPGRRPGSAESDVGEPTARPGEMLQVKRWRVLLTGSTTYFDFTQIRNLATTSIRIVSRHPAGSSMTAHMVAHEVFPWIHGFGGRSGVAFASYKPEYRASVQADPEAGRFVAGGFYQDCVAIITEYAFDYVHLLGANAPTNSTKSYGALSSSITDLSCVYVSARATSVANTTAVGAVSGLYQPTGYYPDDSSKIMSDVVVYTQKYLNNTNPAALQFISPEQVVMQGNGGHPIRYDIFEVL